MKQDLPRLIRVVSWLGLSFFVLAATVIQPAAAAGDEDQPIRPIIAGQAPGGRALMPSRARAGTYSIQDDDQSSQLTPFHLKASGDDLWRLTLENKEVTFFHPAKDGSVMIPREEDLGENVKMTYTPALEMLPGQWPKGLVVEGSVKMLVTNLETGAAREKGECNFRVELLGRQRVATPAGNFDAYLVRETRHIYLQLAKVDVVCDTWYVPGKGDVKEHTRERTRALGLFGGWHVEDSELAR